jgi:hypothetical protein
MTPLVSSGKIRRKRLRETLIAQHTDSERIFARIGAMSRPGSPPNMVTSGLAVIFNGLFEVHIFGGIK